MVFVAGLLIAGQINRGIYRLAWNPRWIGPWSPPDPDAPHRQWWDRIPIVGWFGLAREEKVHGTLFWFRPLAIEVAFAVGLAMLYQWEVMGGFNDWRQLGLAVPMVSMERIHAQFLSHMILLSLMTIATFIDFDEKTIPDAITIPGTAVGLGLAGCLPNSLPANPFLATPASPGYSLTDDFLQIAAPHPWPDWFHGVYGLILGLLCIIAWWYAILPKTLTLRKGWFKALCIIAASIRRHPWTKWMTWGVLLPALVLVTAVWYWGGIHWRGMFTALVGLAFGGGLVWSFRVVASWALKQEALGFGDVTLMAMIGTYVGWQPALLIFFLAPFAGAVVGLLQFVITRKHEIAYGPYLCVATVYLLLRWPPIWAKPISGRGATIDYFDILGIYIPIGLALCLVAMAAMLSVWMRIKSAMFAGDME